MCSGRAPPSDGRPAGIGVYPSRVAGYRALVPGPPSAPSRRSALITGCAGLVGLAASGTAVTACGRGGGAPAPSDPPAPAPDPDAGVRESARRAEEALLALHAATVARHPDLGAELAPATGHHRRHLDALTPATGRRATAATDPGRTAPTPTPATTTTTPAPAVPDDPGAALAAVRDAESDAAAERLLDCVASTDAGLAAVLASVGAAEAAHAALLAGRA